MPNEQQPSPTELAPTESPVSTADAVANLRAAGPDRYEERSLLGKGGMGEVMLTFDRRVGREVAHKVVRGAGRGTTMRFVREALIQARLEHPAFVPVYDVLVDEGGDISFTMRRIRGQTLRELLIERQQEEEQTSTRRLVTRHRLLTSLVQLCLAVDYAHSRGVVHRDVKPENVMFGDFGEVYLLDWGVAKAAGEDEPDAISSEPGVSSGERLTPAVLEPASSALQTMDGTILGTVGYMAPEQLRGEHAALDGRADVYSLGAILFEILTLEKLHVGRNLGLLVQSTMTEREQSPAERAPNRGIPAELDAICVKATAMDRTRRFANARAMADALESFLDTDRDQARRRRESSSLVEAARVSLAGAERADARVSAGRDAVRALALDPESDLARNTLVAALTGMPDELPPEALASAEESTAAGQASLTASFGWTLLVMVAAVSLALIAADIQDPVFFALSLASALGASLGFLASAQARGERAHALMTLAFAGLCIANGMLTLWVTPWIVVPMLMVVNSATSGIYGTAGHRAARLAMVALVGLTPVALEQAGWMPPSFELVRGSVHITPHLPGMALLFPWPMAVFQTFATVVGAILLERVLARVRQMERRFHGHAWMVRTVVAP